MIPGEEAKWIKRYARAQKKKVPLLPLHTLNNDQDFCVLVYLLLIGGFGRGLGRVHAGAAGGGSGRVGGGLDKEGQSRGLRFWLRLRTLTTFSLVKKGKPNKQSPCYWFCCNFSGGAMGTRCMLGCREIGKKKELKPGGRR